MGGGKIRFGEFELDAGAHSVTRGHERTDLPPLSFKLLEYLAERAPEAVSRTELLDAVWPDRVVSDETLTERVKLLRQALQDDPTNPGLIITVRGWGYRLATAETEDRE